ncbi:tRNA pseudouridine(38-40) synthase TruA [Kangiella sediminilitoris]|uniref:tRNA pseudouridine synthase A n=1 Tax=Kangiella sediminilitoris TaxID=1144748 RepID=A0A1B3BAC8_9GAMM|nr:tRNA pseudouridine(38-40) synthase TruA [Kangiella sediminilitoris]AOE49728.1 tRNA pseudouridine synthase A [Kangiella sediminilitoris]
MKFALGIEYDGSYYYGWQRQSHAKSVQQTLEEVLSKIADEPVQVNCAGRTDTGVHATGQVVSFDISNERPLKAWTMGANTQLPDSVAVRWAHEVPDDFHARFSATARRYRYIIANTHARPAILNHGLTWCRQELDVEAMNAACTYFPGEQDFASFQASSCQSRTSFRFINHLTVERYHDYVVIDIKANAFLHHMVRNIAGTLIEVGKGLKPASWVKELIEERNRASAPATASPNGLYLVDVDYPEKFELPRLAIGPVFLPKT